MAQESYLLDRRFLKALDELLTKEVYIKIITLTKDESPLEEIQGKISGGNLSIDGSSSLRRTGALTFIPDEKENNLTDVDNIISINKRIKLSIGYKNTLASQYPAYAQYDIIWFPLGIFIITGSSSSTGLEGTNISIQFQDKMCLLNGTIGGTIPASIGINTYATYNASGGYTGIEYVSVYDMIYTFVRMIGEEIPGKIIISDIPSVARKVLLWNGSGEVYLKSGTPNYFTTEQAGGTILETYSPRDILGYEFTDFIIPEELIADYGTTVCDMLDKIKNMLGNFEYFYDVDGNFIFQEIKNYLNTAQSTLIINQMTNNTYAQDIAVRNRTIYDFNNSNLITSFSNNPQYNLIKNDYTVWGERKSLNSDVPLPIRYHLVLEQKPTPSQRASGVLEDWRNVFFRQGIAASGYALDSNSYYIELQNEWPKLYDSETLTWNASAIAAPWNLDYFLDFISSETSLNQLNVSNIGKRSLVVKDDKVNCLFPPVIPDRVIVESTNSSGVTEAVTRQLDFATGDSTIFSNLVLAPGYKDAFSVVRDLLYQHTSYGTSITLQSLPVYYLDVNTLIGVYDNETNISGNYMIKSITVPLTINETMTINANQVLERI